MYGSEEDSTLKLFNRYDHGLSNAVAAKREIRKFVLQGARIGLADEHKNTMGENLAEDCDKVELRRKGGELMRNESAEQEESGLGSA